VIADFKRDVIDTIGDVTNDTHCTTSSQWPAV